MWKYAVFSITPRSHKALAPSVHVEYLGIDGWLIVILWDCEPEASEGEVQVSDVSDFSNILYSRKENKDSDEIFDVDFPVDQVLYCRVKVYTGMFSGMWSDPVEFTIEDA